MSAPVSVTARRGSAAVASRWTLGVAVAIFLLSACISAPARPTSRGDSRLDAWVDKELAPYLAEHLSRHPRFKGETVLLVRTEEANVRAEIDDLTREVRSELTEALLDTPGVQLLWRPAVPPWKHHRSQKPLRCRDENEADYYIGIEAAAAPGGEYRVSVRALDLADRTWVSGFGKQWQGRLSSAERAALRRTSTDEYLRGLRVLPFAAGQSDQLAAYLAHNVSCLLRDYETDTLSVYAEPADSTQGQASPPLGTTVGLVSNYLARIREVRVVDDRDSADLILRGEAHEIHGGLYQFWMVARAGPRSPDLAGVATEAYIQLRPAGLVAGETPAGPAPAFSAPLPTAGAGLSALRIVAPYDTRLCRTEEPWRHGAQVLDAADPLGPGDCFAVEVDLTQGGHLFLLNYPVRTDIVRLLPTTCGRRLGTLHAVEPGQTVRFPAADTGGGALFRWDAEGIETFYAVLALDLQAAAEIDRYLRRIPSVCNPRPGPLGARDFERLMQQIDGLMARLGNRLVWQAVRVRHDVEGGTY